MADTPEVPVIDPTSGETRMVPREGVDAFTKQTGWHVATSEQREVAAENIESGTAGQQALAAGEQVVRTGTLGLAPGIEGWQQREKVLRRESPVISGAAQAVGAIAPALATGGLAGGAAGALGLGARGSAAVAAGAEGLGGALADDVEQARYESRDVSLGNVMLYGLGGELVGRALPHAFSMGAGNVRRALTGAEAAAGEGLTDALVGTEERALKSQAELATELPKGSAERADALRKTAPEQYSRMATEAAGDLDQIADLTSKMGDTSSSPRVVSRLKETLAEDSPAQTDFFTGVKQGLSDAKKKIRAVEDVPGARSPVNLEGKSLEDLRALPVEDAADRARVEALKQNPDFARTGRVTSNDGRKGITLVDDGGDTVLRDGRHRLTAAAELGLDTVYGQVVDGATGKLLYEGDIPLRPVAKGASLADAPGMRGFSKRFDQIVDSTQKRLDKTTDNAESFLIARDAKKQLQQLSKKMGLTRAPQDAVLHDEFRAMVDDSWRGINQGLKDRSLFGTAADIETDINGAWSEKVIPGLGVSEGDLARKVDVDFRTGRTIAEYDPKKVRSFLQGDAVDRQLSQGKLEQVLEGAEEMAAAHERHGTWPPEQIEKLRDAVGRVRDKLSLADELQAAKGSAPVAGARAEKSLAEHAADKAKNYVVNRAAGAAGAAAGALIGGPVGAALGWGVGELAQTVGQRLVGIDAAARAATKQAARNLAGVGLGYAQRVAGKIATGSAGGAAAAGAMTALSRFQGDYPDAQASFEAKKQLLEQHAIQPQVLYETLGSALGDLPKVRPDLFQAIARRTSEKIRFVQSNLPPGLEASLMYPTGKPVSQSDLREFAMLWNTVMNPHTVVEDINAGQATRQQMNILQKSDPESYAQLRNDIITEIGAHFKDVPTSTKVQLGLLLGKDDLAGPFFSANAARYVGDAKKMEAQQGKPAAPSSAAGKATPAAAPAGLSAIQTSVTNRQAA
jgi:hypothetical protein